MPLPLGPTRPILDTLICVERTSPYYYCYYYYYYYYHYYYYW